MKDLFSHLFRKRLSAMSTVKAKNISFTTCNTMPIIKENGSKAFSINIIIGISFYFATYCLQYRLSAFWTLNSFHVFNLNNDFNQFQSFKYLFGTNRFKQLCQDSLRNITRPKGNFTSRLSVIQ